ncbi:unnamed protein product [Arctia plantaginis]|uniref:Peptidase S1 domain-containing protein n=1 Tax=Arctia plantaginis TaxID=874455 RepID=A0A8S0YSI9_ARCPL|nr:unnamed protein product [Arctia plantaginis]
MSFVTPPAVTRDARNEVFPCSRGVNSLDEFRCQNGTGCVSVKHLCDGVPHCSDKSDEEFCPHRRSDLQTEDWMSHRRKRQSTCGSDQWKCLDGSCISLDNICNGVDDCTDRSDETHPFCKKLLSLTKAGGCILPSYPTHGSYEVSKLPNARPGQALDSFVLTVTCRRGFGIVHPDGGDGSGTQQLYCVNGEYQYQTMPRCVRFCKLNPDPSVRYTCHVPGVGFKTCKNYVAPGTLVNPICNSPIYYTTESLPYMKCNFGYWDYVAQCRAECGRVTPEGTQLVIDGKPAKRGELPWHVGIYRKITSPYLQICGGTLITNNVVLSAAHCFWSDLKKKLPESDFAVAVGKLYRDWDSENDIGAQKSDLLEIRIPSRFQGAEANFQEDIAALILKTPFVYMTYVRPVCVYYDVNFERIQLRPGNAGKVAGWGLTSAQGTAANLLQVIEMPFINVDTCINTIPQSFREYITGDKFCAGYTTGKALCKGDSGGGLAFPDRGLGVDRYYLRGIVSAAPRDDQKLCNDNTYTTFTMITKHQDFIKEALAVSAVHRCPQYSFQCDDGSCVDQGSDCNGRQDCADGSDESDELCKPGFVKPTLPPIPEPSPLAIPVTKPPSSSDLNSLLATESCILPPYPDYGTYETNIPISDPGRIIFGSVTLIVTCQQGYGIVTLEDGAIKNSTTIHCVKGNWNQSIVNKCVRVCRLVLDSSIDSNYSCLATAATGFKPTQCDEYVTSGTAVSVSCKSPNYYSDRELPHMRCISGYWDYYPRCKAECGRISPKVIETNGLPVERTDPPWHVGIHRKFPKPYTQVCGGSIISKDAVISAAHCFWNMKVLPASDYAVAAGKLHRAWNDARDENAQKSDVKEINVPRRFQGSREDIAVLILVTPFVFSTFVSPVCLSFDYDLENRQLQEGMLGQVSGWGRTSINGNFSPVLKNIQMPYISVAQCRSKISVADDKFCAGLQNENLCEGDGGAGIAFPSSTGTSIQRYYLRGVVSRPSGRETICDDSPFNVFTYITKHEDFIKDFI